MKTLSERKMNKQEKAIELKHNRNNCAQAVLCAYAEDLQMSEEILRKIGAAFGGGMGNMEGNCGALCGAEAVLGMLKFQGKSLGKEAAALYNAFREKCGSTVCKEIKGTENGKMLCSCDDCVRIAVETLEEVCKGN